MLTKVRNHVGLALAFYGLTLLQQYLFYALQGIPIISFGIEKHLIGVAFFLVFTFAKGPLCKFFFLNSLLLLNLFQMVHQSYFGTQILPTEIYLLFSQFGEITGVLGEELRHVLVPFLFCLIPVGIGTLFLRRFKNLYSGKLFTGLLIAYFIYNPTRTFITGNTWGRQPSTRELSGMNVYLSLSYFLGRILPAKLSQHTINKEKNSSLNLSVTDTSIRSWDNIILVLGESLSPHQMSLFGYNRPTTPNLEAFARGQNFFKTHGISSGVSTDVSVAFFLNLGYGDAGAIKATTGQHCLFRLAKTAGYSTHFFSSQSDEQLRYIAPYLCNSFLDDYRSLESISPGIADPNAASDRSLLPKLHEIITPPGKNFIILHQRGSHGPWKMRSRGESIKFKGTDTDERLNDYDNSVVEFDLFWRDLATQLAKQKSKTLVIYISDHGESVGKDQRWGHGFLDPSTFEVPILIQSFNKELPSNTMKLPPFLAAYNLGLYTIQALGYNLNQGPSAALEDYVVYGNDIDGFAGKARIKFEGTSYRFEIIP